MTEKKWVIQKWRLGDRFEGLTLPEAFAKLFEMAEEEGYELEVAYPENGERYWRSGTWKTAMHDFTNTQYLVLTPPAPEPVDEWRVWREKHEIALYYGMDGMTQTLANRILDAIESMPERGKGE